MRADRLSPIVAAVLGALGPAWMQAASGPVDVQRSTMTVFVYKAGLFSAFADDHVILAPLASGTISETPPLAINLVVNSADLVVLDPDLDPSKRAEVRARMLGPDVLDAATFPVIAFESTRVDPVGSGRWNVSGRLTIRGVTRPVDFAAIREGGRYRGAVRINQRDFGIEPIRIAGGVVRVKDELTVRFEIATAEAGWSPATGASLSSPVCSLTP